MLKTAVGEALKVFNILPDGLQLKMLVILSMNVDLKTDWRQMAIENTASSDFLSTFIDC